MPHARQTASSLRTMECPVLDDLVVVHGLPYGNADRPRALRGLVRAGRVTVIVDDHVIESVLVRDPRDGSLLPLQCLASRATRLEALIACLDVRPAFDQEAGTDEPRMRPAA